jgi:hypothetical protein
MVFKGKILIVWYYRVKKGFLQLGIATANIKWQLAYFQEVTQLFPDCVPLPGEMIEEETSSSSR